MCARHVAIILHIHIEHQQYNVKVEIWLTTALEESRVCSESLKVLLRLKHDLSVLTQIRCKYNKIMMS